MNINTDAMITNILSLTGDTFLHIYIINKRAYNVVGFKKIKNVHLINK